MSTFHTLQRTKIDDIFLGLAKVGIVSALWLGMSEMSAHNIEQTGRNVEYRRKDEDTTEAQQRRELRKAMREADKTKQARNRYRQMKRAEYLAKWNKLWNQAQRDTIILTVNIQ